MSAVGRRPLLGGGHTIIFVRRHKPTASSLHEDRLSACSLPTACSASLTLITSAGLCVVLHTAAASAAPMRGATIKTHSWLNAHPPTKTAGAMLRAGLTEVLVTGMPTRWISVSTSP